MCILEEMQWIERGRCTPRTSSTDRWSSWNPGVSCLLFKGEDGSRSLVDRVEQFVEEHERHVDRP